jgi:DNA repair ATPase RecN
VENIVELTKGFESLNDELITKKAKRDILEKEKENLEKEIESYKIEDLDMQNIVLQKMAERQRRAAANKLQNLGTSALQYAVSPNYSMEIDITPVKKKPNAEVLICKNNGIKTDPEDSNGGGIIDITSLGLRVITLETHDPFINGPLIFDEPGKMVSKEYIPDLAEFIKKVSNDFGRQIILVTHNDFLSELADTKIRVHLDEDTNESYFDYE